MRDKTKEIANIIVVIVIVLGLGIFGLIEPDKDYSDSERRALASMPEVNLEKIFSGEDSRFMDDFEGYAEDQFPLREQFRMVNSATSRYLLGKSENNNLCIKDGYIIKLDYVINTNSINRSISRMKYISDTYLSGDNVFFAVIPDKNYYLSARPDVLTYDYDEFMNICKNETKDFASFIDLRDHLSIRNYYYTDTHWKQETLQDVADYLIYSMIGNDWSYSTHNAILCENLFTDDFEGVYYGQLALPVRKDSIMYMDGHYVDSLVAYCYDTGSQVEIDIYDEQKGKGKDPYELYLTGSKSLITIENKEARDQRELIVFRDSFGSSIATLLAGGYSKVTLIDIRYISPEMLGKFVDFEDKDILFLYSSQVLNNTTFK